MNKIYIFDTTLRDGEQSAGNRLTSREKLSLALKLEESGIDIIEAGFPVSSPEDYNSVELVSREIKNTKVCALSRCNFADIKSAGSALSRAICGRIHTGIGVSNIHMEKKLKMKSAKVLAKAVESVKYATTLVPEVEFYAEDATRAERGFLLEVVDAVIQAGATTINIPDTTGYAIPEQFGSLIAEIYNKVIKNRDVNLAVHCHNDLGMATANTLAAVKAGANQVECTVNGIGERAGNASLEEVVMGLIIRKDYFSKSSINFDIKNINLLSTEVAEVMKIPVSINKPVVGENVFAHSSGIHVDGVLKERDTYEIITPQSVGRKENKIILTARSGRHALKYSLGNLGYDYDETMLEDIYHRFIALADTKKVIDDGDLLFLVRK